MNKSQDTNKQDLYKIYAILSENTGNPFPEGIREEHFKVPFINHNGVCKEANGCLYMPESKKPVPLVYYSYYKITRDSFELAQYLREGWAVACPYEEADNNSELTRDGLVSNSALLYQLCHRPEIDAGKIGIIGGSAGGYTAMMLSALHLLGCTTLANGALANVYFNFRHYAPYLSTFNLPAALALKEEERGDLMTLLSRLPIPYGIVFNTCRTPEIDARLDDLQITAALTPALLTDCFSNPLMEMHYTSDILVPVDQITKSFTYEHVSSDLPENFKIRLSAYDLPGDFGRSFTQMLPEGSFTECLLPVVPEGMAKELPFDDKRFQINIIDEGEPQSHGSHSSHFPKGHMSDIAWLRHCFAQGNKNNFLTAGKLKLLMERYAGKSIQMPAHEGGVYGSLKLYRKEIVEQLSTYMEKHPQENIYARLRELGKINTGLADAVEGCIRELRRG